MSDRFVYFDLGKVLVEFEHETAVTQLAQLCDCEPNLARETVFGSPLQQRYETGLISCAEYCETIRQELDSTADDAQILRAASDIFSPNHAILPILDLVRRSTARSGILSNTCRSHWEWIAKQNWPTVPTWADVVILSYEVQSMKPDRAIYEESARQAGCAPEQIFFTDDREENVVAAAAQGWTVHHYQAADPLLQQLESWLS